MLLGLTSLVKLGCAAASSNESDRVALLSFKAMITHDPYETLSSWNDSLSFCEWQGVTCSRYIPRVIMLNLQSRRLVGTISPSIANLTLLAWISLGDNGFYGQIPSEIGQLSRLIYINLSHNSLESEIPSNITMLSNLQALDIAYNRLVGRIPAHLGLCQNLISIRLRSNNLTGSIPPSLGNLSSLEAFTIRYNYLKGSIPKDLGRLVQLRELLLEANSLSGTVPSSIYNLSTLVALGLSDNLLRGVLPPDLGIRLPHLQYLGVGANSFIGPLPPTLANASLLSGLEFGYSKFTGHLPTNLGSLARLIQFSVVYSNLESSDLSFLNSFTNCTNLEFLSLQGNRFRGRLPESISNLSTKLIELTLEFNEIRGFIPSGISRLASLLTFSLQNNLLTGTIPSSIGMLQKLQYLDLSSNKLFGLIPSSVGNLSNIYEINLSYNSLSGSIPWSLGDSWSLHILNLTKNNLSGAIPKRLPINLRGFVASYNSLSGPLPMEMSSMVSLLVLDVSRNQISGEVPSTIGKFMRLGLLDLSGNNFQGTILSSLSSLKDVEFIDLSRNYFKGIIPDFLSTLTTLQHLDLSFNDFEGEVPKRGVFTNTSVFFVQGNHNLCGGVSQLNLPACTIQASAKRKISSILLAVLTTCSIVVCSILLLSVCALCYRRNSRKRISSVATKGYWKLKLTYEEIYAATDGFSQSNLVGSGWSGSVYKGKLNNEGRTIAVKVLSLQKRNAYKTFLAECEALSRIRHRNILKILTCCSCVDPDGNYFFALVLEFMSNGSLEEWLHQKNLNIFQRLNIAIEVASALDYLHNHCQDAILHRDLKPSNILLDDNMSARISDFGLARILTPGGYVANSSSLSGTFGYAPPEYGLGAKASTSGDVYSYGIVLLELFTRRRPTDGMFSDDNDLHNFVKIAMPERIMEILDPSLLSTSDEIEVGINKGLMLECLIPILRIGTNCSSKSRQDRMDIKDVINELERIRKRLSTVAPATADKSSNQTREMFVWSI